MNDKIEFHFAYETEDYNRGRKYIQSRNLLLRYFYLFPLVIFALSLLFNFFRNPALFWAMFSQPQAFLPIVLVLFIVIPFFYFLRRKNVNPIGNSIAKWQIKSAIKSSPVLQQAQYLAFDETGLLMRNALTENLIKWDAFIEATETKDDFYFFTAKKIARFVPKREFISEDQQNQLRILARSKLGDKAKF